MGESSSLLGTVASVFLERQSPRCHPTALYLAFAQWESMHWPQWWIQNQILRLVKKLLQHHSVKGRLQSSLRHASELSSFNIQNDRSIIVIFCAVSLVASTTVDAGSIFGMYVRSGLAIMILPCINVTWAHLFFQAILSWSILSALYWIGIGTKLWSVKKDIKLG